jgi:hypothetical protein
MSRFHVLIHREIDYEAGSPEQALELAIADLNDNLEERLVQDGPGEWTSSNADVVSVGTVSNPRRGERCRLCDEADETPLQPHTTPNPAPSGG